MGTCYVVRYWWQASQEDSLIFPCFHGILIFRSSRKTKSKLTEITRTNIESIQVLSPFSRFFLWVFLGFIQKHSKTVAGCFLGELHFVKVSTHFFPSVFCTPSIEINFFFFLIALGTWWYGNSFLDVFMRFREDTKGCYNIQPLWRSHRSPSRVPSGHESLDSANGRTFKPFGDYILDRKNKV